MMKRGMNVPIWRSILASIALGIVLPVLSVGCSTTASLPPHIAVGLDGLRNEAVSLRGQVEKTVGALKEMMTKPQADLSPQYQSFTHELGILEAKVEEARQQRAATETVVKDQFMAWDENLKQLQNEESRQRAAERRSATESTYSGIQQKIAELKKVWTPFVTDLKDTRQYLKSDLSKEGLHTIEPTAERVFDQQGNVIKQLDDVIEAMDVAIKRT
ncbi:MAG: DUF2959 family protein [Nitrospirota bacterium]|nr:DUF2959 family protein [Nitrospirota bacterium]